MAASGPGITDIKKLFARSGNRCAFTKCRASMVVNQTLIGEICHIKGEKPGSARHDPAQTDADRHAYTNLVLMCPNHHTVIDDDERSYTVERLREIKTTHEAQATPVADAEVVATAVFTQSVKNIGQSGGLSAHTVSASTINLQSAPSTSHLTHQRQIQAVEHLWQVVGKLSSEFSAVILVDNVITPSELDGYLTEREHPQIEDFVREYADMNHVLRKLGGAVGNDAAKERPFVSHRLWSIVFVRDGAS